MLVEGDDVRFGEDVTLAGRKIGDHVIQGHRFESKPRNVSSRLKFKFQNSNFRFKAGSKVFGDRQVDDGYPAEGLVAEAQTRVALLGVGNVDCARAERDLLRQVFVRDWKRSIM